MIKRKIANKAMAIAIATVTFTVPFTNAVSAMEKSITTKNYNILENQKKNDELKYLIDELNGIEGVDTDALIKELQSIKFEYNCDTSLLGLPKALILLNLLNVSIGHTLFKQIIKIMP